jgi:transposase
MLKMPLGVRIYVALLAVDMRKYADGLSALVMSKLGQEPMSGHVFVFFNRRRDIIRILFWERDGYWVLSKKVQRGHFRSMRIDGELDGEPASVGVTAEQLHEILVATEIGRNHDKPTLH